MKKIKNYLLALILSVSMNACSYLDIVPDNVATIEYAFQTRTAAESYLFTCYSWLPHHAAIAQVPVFLAGDEVWLYPDIDGREPWQIALGNQNIVDPILNFWGGKLGGRNLYRGIRECNIFLENIDNVAEMSSYEKNLWRAEVKFLKAYFHFYLMRMYGPIPIVRENLPISATVDEVKAVTRRPVDECVDYVVELLDEASEYLLDEVQFEATEKGRITRPIAKAFKARVLVTAASPLFNGNTDYANFIGSDGEQLFNQTHSGAKWVAAAEACKEAVELCHSLGYKLYYYMPSVGSFPLSDTTTTELNYRGAIVQRWNPEIIWGNPNSQPGNLQTASQPRLHQGGYFSGVHAPPLKIAELFYTKHGVPINEDKDYHYEERFGLRLATEQDRLYLKPGEQLPVLHFDREPRFYASLAFDGGRWFGTGWFSDSDLNYVSARAGGVAAGHPTSFSSTGYWSKKWVNYQNTATINNYVTQPYPYPVIRLADLYLMYAEALNEAYGPTAEAYQYIDLVRERAGLPTVQEAWLNHSVQPAKFEDKVGLREIIHQERLIELAFEGYRFWDLRRWKKAIQVLNQPIMGWSIDYEAPQDYYRPRLLFNQNFTTRDYLWPIEEAEILRNQNLQQAPGW